MSMFVTSLHLASFQFDPNAKQEASTRNSAFCQVAEPKDISKQNNVVWAAAPRQCSAAWSGRTKCFVSNCPKGKPSCIHGWHGLEQSKAWVGIWTGCSFWPFQPFLLWFSAAFIVGAFLQEHPSPCMSMELTLLSHLWWVPASWSSTEACEASSVMLFAPFCHHLLLSQGSGNDCAGGDASRSCKQ